MRTYRKLVAGRAWMARSRCPFWPACLAAASAMLANALLGAPALAAALPDGIRAMIAAAYADGDATTITTVVRVAKQADPADAAAIDALTAQLSAAKPALQAANQPPSPAAPPKSPWSGEVALGGSQSTGASQDLELYGAVKLVRTGGDWTQKFNARIDYGEAAHIRTTDRISAAYQPQYRFDADRYGYGLTEYEHDQALGYRDRFTVGGGVGFKAVDDADLKLDFDVGPVFRFVRYYAHEQEDKVAARGSMTVSWRLAPGAKVSEEAALYFDPSHTSARSTLALDAELFGPLKTRLSYDVQYETNVPLSQRQFDSVARAALVYGF